VSENGTRETGAKIESRPILKKLSSSAGPRGIDRGNARSRVGVVVVVVVWDVGDLSTKR
jgi:hypothetical protein